MARLICWRPRRLPLEAVAVKALAHWLTTGLPLVLRAGAGGAFAPAGAGLWLAGAVAADGNAGAVDRRFGAALTVGLRRGGLLMSLLVLPLYVPTLIFGAEAARRGADGRRSGDAVWCFWAGSRLGAGAGAFAAAAAAIRVNLR
jgi:heme exporter protein B